MSSVLYLSHPSSLCRDNSLRIDFHLALVSTLLGERLSDCSKSGVLFSSMGIIDGLQSVRDTFLRDSFPSATFSEKGCGFHVVTV